jgi:DNA-binding response OmpR family regulator
MTPASINKPISGLKPKSMPKKILVVSNDPQIRKVLQNLLQSEGHGVVLAATGREGIRRFHADRFDLMLVDVNLPDTSDWNIFKTLTSINPFPPIVVTGRNGQRELVVFEGGAILAKLLDVSEIMQAIAGDSRRTFGDPSLISNGRARRGDVYAASIGALLRAS